MATPLYIALRPNIIEFLDTRTGHWWTATSEIIRHLQGVASAATVRKSLKVLCKEGRVRKNSNGDYYTNTGKENCKNAANNRRMVVAGLERECMEIEEKCDVDIVLDSRGNVDFVAVKSVPRLLALIIKGLELEKQREDQYLSAFPI